MLTLHGAFISGGFDQKQSGHGKRAARYFGKELPPHGSGDSKGWKKQAACGCVVR